MFLVDLQLESKFCYLLADFILSLDPFFDVLRIHLLDWGRCPGILRVLSRERDLARQRNRRFQNPTEIRYVLVPT